MAWHKGTDDPKEGHEVPEGSHVYRHLPDCPKCKYGTLENEDGKWKCIDCHAMFNPTERGYEEIRNTEEEGEHEQKEPGRAG